jgi:hypothetical protein
MNAFGSRITPDGKAAKACADSRRIAVALPHELGAPGATTYLLRVPQSSLKNMKNYTIDQLARNGYEPGGCITRLSFDAAVAYPKLQFEFVSPVSDVEYDNVITLASSPSVASMLKAPDFESGASAVNAVPPAQAQRQAPPVLTPEDDEVVVTQHVARQQAPVLAPEPKPTPAPVQESADWIALDDGQNEINLTTGEVRQIAKALPDMGLDPDVIVTSDGRFFNKATKKFVPTQFRGGNANTSQVAANAVVAAVQQEAAKPKRTRAKAQAELNQQAIVPENNGPSTNGSSEPMVVAASPKLEALLAGMTPKKN